MPVPDPRHVALLPQVQQFWNSGSQGAAIDLLRSHADEGEAWAAALLAWLLMQQGYPALDESINWAIKAAERGLTSQLSTTFNNVIANLPSYPQLASRLPELFQLGLPWPSGVDPVGQGWNLIANNQPELGLQLMMLPSQMPYPVAEPHMDMLLRNARSRVNELSEAVSSARDRRHELQVVSNEARAAIEKAKDDLETSAKQAGLLVTAATSDATNALFIEDAKRNAKESRGAWRWGLGVLGAAAIVAVLPVILHYLQLGVEYSAFEQVAVHLVSTAALATFAGVLLARARSRDQAAQRAHDLSTAMGTMISYSNQISDVAERQRFMTAMGQMVLQAHLTSGSKSGGSEESLAGIIALTNLIKPSSLQATASST